MCTRISLAVLLILVPAGEEFSAVRSHADETVARAPSGVVYLEKSRGWGLMTRDGTDEGLLTREILRQAFLIASRDELGLTTRDAWLGDPPPDIGSVEPFDLAISPGWKQLLEVVRGHYPQQAKIAGRILDVAGDKSDLDYQAYVNEAERLSRDWFAGVLRDAGFSGQPNPLDSTAMPAAAVEKQLSELTFTSQFAAARQLHDAIRRHGESPALTGALIRAYANLGLLTEFDWHPAHKVFKARALLYAQRLCGHENNSPWALRHRAYAAALGGLHQWALQDLDAADKAQASADGAADEAPAWLPLVQALCRYESDALDAARTDAQYAELARLLQYISYEESGSGQQAIECGLKVVKAMTECYRVHDGLCRFGGVALGHSATVDGPATLSERLYPRLAGMTGLPDPVTRIVARQPSAEEPRDFGEELAPPAEFRQRVKLMTALRDAGRISLPALPKPAADDAPAQPAAVGPELDVGEPSWAVLGQLIQEVSFVQVWRRAYFEYKSLGVPADEYLISARPLVENHRYRVLLDTYVWENTDRAQALANLAKLEPESLEIVAQELAFGLDGYDERWRQWYRCAYVHHDRTARDLTLLIDSTMPRSRAPLFPPLYAVSPYSPVARAGMIAHHWDQVKDQAGRWEKESVQYPSVLVALADRASSGGHWADAERLYSAAIRLSPEMGTYKSLAEAYQKQGKTDHWLATLEDFLQQPDYGLQHAQVQVDIANHYMERHEWEKALPYAMGAAGTGSQWGMLAAAKCYEALQDWNPAEEMYRVTSLRYRGSSLQWYYFCRRTGQGDAASARDAALDFMNTPGNVDDDLSRFEAGEFWMLDRVPDEAIKYFERLAAESTNPYYGLHLALLADQAKKTGQRDAALDRVVSKGEEYLRIATQQPRRELVGLAKLMVADLKNGGHGEIDLMTAKRLRSTADETEQMNFNYYLAKYLDLHGKPDEARQLWMHCMGYRIMFDYIRTLAGAELQDHGVRPDDYKDLVQQNPKGN